MADQVPHVGADAVVPPLAGVDRDLHRSDGRRRKTFKGPGVTVACRPHAAATAICRGIRRSIAAPEREAQQAGGARGGPRAARGPGARRAQRRAAAQRPARRGAARAAAEAVVLAVVAQVAAVVLEPRARRARAMLAAEVVDDLGRGREERPASPRCAHPHAQVDVLLVEEEALVEAAHGVERARGAPAGRSRRPRPARARAAARASACAQRRRIAARARPAPAAAGATPPRA